MSSPQQPTLSIIIPFYNEYDNLPLFHQRLTQTLKPLPYRMEILYIDDGSTDMAAEWVTEQAHKDPRIALLRLSRNFGKEHALSAGIDYCHGDAAIVIDADLQDPPELIPQLIAPWQENKADVVYAQRLSRQGDSLVKRLTAHLFYRLMARTRPVIPYNAGDFRLMNRQALDDIKTLREKHRFMKGLFTWIGHRQYAVPYHREPRHKGRSKWSYFALWHLSIEAITSFTTAPLRIASYLGLGAVLFSLTYGSIILFRTIAYGSDVPGYPSLMMTILFIGGVQMFTIGILGEYIGRIFNEVKQRPLYLVRAWHPSQQTRPQKTRHDHHKTP
ncbi:MAG: glycosyltransferase family 2 protein [Alphaproteobacteria bacterium GM7ARS4]|nr:glycosyltransferase family 2 protein [Alphaproteobacteria bacterium GM7ARS4]